MMSASRPLLAAALAALVVSAGASGADAQACTTTVRTDPPPPRDVIACAGGLTITAERGTAYRLLDPNRDGRPEGAELTDKGLLVESPPGRRRFQINTPHAIASVRGTVWAVDVGAVRTSVFVEEGAVAVRRQGGRQTVTLRAGDGVDVDAGTAPLEVKRWSAQRAAALLARFGRR